MNTHISIYSVPVNDVLSWLRDDDDDDDYDDGGGGTEVLHLQRRTEPAASSPIDMLLHISTSTSGISYFLTYSNIFKKLA
jgi:hypothetical protein